MKITFSLLLTTILFWYVSCNFSLNAHVRVHFRFALFRVFCSITFRFVSILQLVLLIVFPLILHGCAGISLFFTTSLINLFYFPYSRSSFNIALCFIFSCFISFHFSQVSNNFRPWKLQFLHSLFFSVAQLVIFYSTLFLSLHHISTSRTLSRLNEMFGVSNISSVLILRFISNDSILFHFVTLRFSLPHFLDWKISFTCWYFCT